MCAGAGGLRHRHRTCLGFGTEGQQVAGRVSPVWRPWGPVREQWGRGSRACMQSTHVHAQELGSGWHLEVGEGRTRDRPMGNLTVATHGGRSQTPPSGGPSGLSL